MAQRSIYLIVRVDVDVPDSYELSDLEIAEELTLVGITTPGSSDLSVDDFEICGLSD